MKGCMCVSFLAVSLLLLSGCSSVSTKAVNPDKARYEKVLEFAGVPDEKLFSRVTAWIETSFAGSGNSLEQSSSSTGVFHGSFSYPVSVPVSLGILGSYDINAVRGVFIIETRLEQVRLQMILEEVLVSDESGTSKWRQASETEYKDLEFDKYGKETAKSLDDFLSDLK